MGLLLFGVTKDITGVSQMELPSGIHSVGELKQRLLQEYPGMARLNSLMIAVNKEYAADTQVISPADEIAVIPPVSGG
ncbi:molybdopterin converting factor subunit 1 [Chitinophaga sp. Cy-1792]|uniref:molybdopterin converting factor subunit 1 n=1 Tax=Chitinophaga sp. Cy-1792 TaxID=2608339 RepID=UPI00196486C2|nr:molybdopterin converting factor subunit 1 [Chitinophaga sp. Cy-1792]